ncbi:MAG: ABC transporter permease [archaeon]
MSALRGIITVWQRELLIYSRSKSRIFGSLGIPLFFLIAFGFGLSAVIKVQGTNYFSFIVPGMIGMVLLFQSIFSGLNMISERQFGFMKEIMVAPVSRISIALGKTLGAATTSTLQGLLVLLISIPLGFMPTQPWWMILLAIPVMLLIAMGFAAIGIAFGSVLSDPQGFQFIMNFLVFPIFLFSGAFFALESLPQWLRAVTFFDPLTYGVDAMRGLMLGLNHLAIPVAVVVLIIFDAVVIIIAARLFNKIQ